MFNSVKLSAKAERLVRYVRLESDLHLIQAVAKLVAGAVVFRQAILVSVMALLILAPCNAQFKQRDVSGVVTDARGNALPSVSVELENTRDQTVRSYITGKDGRYHFNGLNDDIDYTLKAKYKNWWSKPKTLSKFDGSVHAEVDLVIPID
jgi:hypothetical protein